MRIPFVPVKDGVARETVLSGGSAGKPPFSPNSFDILCTPRDKGMEWIRGMGKGEWLTENGYGPEGPREWIPPCGYCKGGRDAAASLPPRPGADGSRACGCSDSFC